MNQSLHLEYLPYSYMDELYPWISKTTFVGYACWKMHVTIIHRIVDYVLQN